MSIPVIFRTDGGAHIGLGHVRRCLSLAGALRRAGAESCFILGGEPELCQIVQAEGFPAMYFPPEKNDLIETVQHAQRVGAASIVVDSYAASPAYFYGLVPSGLKLVAIDDLADRELPVHVLINGSIEAKTIRYQCLKDTLLLLGPEYILLQPEFSFRTDRKIADQIHCVLITLGGSDAYNLTPRLMRWAKKVLDTVLLQVVVGPFFRNGDRIDAEALSLDGPYVLHKDSKDLHALMLSADLTLCGGGQTTYELAATGTPALAVRLAENQTANLRGLDAAGALVWAGDASEATLEEKVCRAMETAKARQWRQTMSRKGQALVDGRGAVRVAQHIVDLIGGS